MPIVAKSISCNVAAPAKSSGDKTTSVSSTSVLITSTCVTLGFCFRLEERLWCSLVTPAKQQFVANRQEINIELRIIFFVTKFDEWDPNPGKRFFGCYLRRTEQKC
jgi:hypothetical protein